MLLFVRNYFKYTTPQQGERKKENLRKDTINIMYIIGGGKVDVMHGCDKRKSTWEKKKTVKTNIPRDKALEN